MNIKNNRKNIGAFGESAATKYLMDIGYSIKKRNYRNKAGELDIVSEKDNVLHVVEVKTVLAKNDGEVIRAEDHLDRKKIYKLRKVTSMFVKGEGIPKEKELSIDAVLVRLFEKKSSDNEFPKNIGRVTVTHIKNIDVL